MNSITNSNPASKWLTQIPPDTHLKLIAKDRQELKQAIELSSQLVEAGMYSSFAERIVELCSVIKTARAQIEADAKQEAAALTEPERPVVEDSPATMFPTPALTAKQKRRQLYDQMVADGRCVVCCSPKEAGCETKVCGKCKKKQRERDRVKRQAKVYERHEKELEKIMGNSA